MKYFRFEWSILEHGYVSTLSVTETNTINAIKRLAAAFKITKPVMRNYLRNHGLSVIEVRKPKIK